MSIHVALNHVTHYRYDRPVALGPQVVRLRPCPHARTRILSYSMRVTPAEHFVNWQQDPQSNYLASVSRKANIRTVLLMTPVLDNTVRITSRWTTPTPLSG